MLDNNEKFIFYMNRNKAIRLVDRSNIELLILRARNAVHIRSGRYEMIDQAECGFNKLTYADVEVKFRRKGENIKLSHDKSLKDYMRENKIPIWKNTLNEEVLISIVLLIGSSIMRCYQGLI